MISVPSLDAAMEGLRVIRREPRSVLAWAFLWLLWFSVTAAAIASGRHVEVTNRISHWTIWEIIRHFGPYAVVLIGLFFLIWGVTSLAAFRAVLQPEDRRFFYLRLGRDELRVAVISLMAFSLLAIFGSGPSVVLIALASPIMAALPALARDIAELGALVTVCLEVWLYVRLSLIAVETFAEHRFHLTAYWPLTRGRFWYLLIGYLVLFVILFAATTVFLGLSGMFFEFARSELIGTGLLRRSVLLGIAGVLALLSAAYWAFNLTLFCAYQAHAYRRITTTRPWG